MLAETVKVTKTKSLVDWARVTSATASVESEARAEMKGLICSRGACGICRLLFRLLQGCEGASHHGRCKPRCFQTVRGNASVDVHHAEQGQIWLATRTQSSASRCCEDRVADASFHRRRELSVDSWHQPSD